MAKQKQSNRNVRRKVIFVFICCCAALGLAWIISRDAFNRVLTTVDNISKPNEKMRLVSQVSRDIMQLDQLQRSQALVNQDGAYNSFERESRIVSQDLDSLKHLYSYDSQQVRRVDSIKTLLSERDKLFKSYIQVREKLIDSQEFAEQLQSIGDIIQDTSHIVSTVVTTQKRTRDVKVEPGDTLKNTVGDDRSFFGRIFGTKRRASIDSYDAIQQPRRTVIEELETLVDTITTARQDSALALIDSVLLDIEERQREQSNSFISHEVELTIAGNVLIGNMLSILNEVEKEAMLQMEKEHGLARSVMNHSIDRLNILVLSFFIITAVLVLLILSDIRKNNRYRIQLEIAKEEAEYHSAAKQRFLSNMSHELRTPLQSIIGYAEQMREENDANNRKVNVIYQSSEHLLQIVNEVLDYNRINSGKFQFHNHAFDLSQLIAEVLAAMQLQADQKKLELKATTMLENNQFVIGDPFRIKQILYNLLSNAIKFTNTGYVSLEAETVLKNDILAFNLKIEDTGEGIAEEDIERIFNEFEQAKNANSGEHFGSGLGLSIVKTLCEAMGGRITIHSELNRGSVFEVYLPLARADEITRSSTSKKELNAVHRFDETVWVVDDDAFILELCKSIFTKNQIKHRCFSTPDEMLGAHWTPDVTTMLMDMRMPGKTGIELNKQIREKIQQPINIYAFTAQALPEERDLILGLGFDGLLLKPFKENDLLTLLGIEKSTKNKQRLIPGKKVDNEDESNDLLDVDFSTLKKLIFYDHEQLIKVITLFEQDTEQDLKTLIDSYTHSDYDNIALLLHKLAGRTAQIGAKKVAEFLRKTELLVRAGNTQIEGDIRTAVHSLNRLIVKLQRYRQKQQETNLLN